MKIALINPPFLFPAKYDFTFSHCLGLRYISAHLKANGFGDVTFIDALMAGFENARPYAQGYLVGLDPDEIAARIPAGTDLIGLSVPFSQLAAVAHELIEKIKARHPQSRLIMGGVYPSTQPRLALHSAADAIVIGEGEAAFLEIAQGRPCRELGVGLVAYSPLGRGFLAGKFKKFEDLDPDDWRRGSPRFQGENFAKNLELVRRVEELARAKGCTPGQLALAWVLARGKDIVPIPGTNHRRHLEENAGTLEVQLSADEVRRIDEIFPLDAAVGDRYPEAAMGYLNG